MLKRIFASLVKPFIGSGIGCYAPIWKTYVFISNLLSKEEIINVHGFKMFRKTCGDLPSIILSGEYESFNSKTFAQLINKDSVVVDIGAHVGYYSLLAASLGAKIIYSFEPEKQRFDFMIDNVILNRFTNVFPVNIAVSNYEREDFIYKSDYRGAQYTMYSVNEKEQKIPVRITTIDNFFPTEIISVIKIDVEGMETAALEGAKQAITRSDDIKVLLEFSAAHLKKAGSSAEILWDTLRELGFSHIYSLGIDGTIKLCELKDVINDSRKFGRDVGATLFCKKRQINISEIAQV
jgi:FkbM family methyltransferase